MKEKKKKNPMEFGEQILEQIGDSFETMDFSELSQTIRSSVDYIRQEAEQGYRSCQENFSKYRENFENRDNYDNHDNYTQDTQEKRYKRNQWVQKKLPVLRKIPGRIGGLVEAIFGGLCAATFGGLSLGFGITAAVIGGNTALFTASLITVGISLPLTIVSGVLLGHGLRARKRAKRFLSYEKHLQGKEYMMLEDLSKVSNQKPEQIKKDLKYIEMKQLAPQLSVDSKGTCLLLSDEARRQYAMAEEARVQREQEEQRYRDRVAGTKEEASCTRFLEACDTFLENLQQKKTEIDAPIMQEHMARVERLVSQIYLCIKEHPEMIVRTGHMASYYLPCMSKLLDTYEELEEQPIQGENIKKTKHEIEISFETIEEAMTNMFDELFQDVSIDISSDIQVLKAMMAQDGWSRNKIQ